MNLSLWDCCACQKIIRNFTETSDNHPCISSNSSCSIKRLFLCLIQVAAGSSFGMMELEDGEKPLVRRELTAGRENVELWLETIWIVLVAIGGLLVGRWASRHSSTARLTAMAISFGIIGLILLARQSALWNILPPLRPVAAGRLRFFLLAFTVTVGLTAPLSQLHSMISRFATCVIMSIFMAILITLPFMGPALIQRDLSAIPTRLDVDGVCLQSQSFTCGPAAAVTALHRLGLDATEGQLAIASRTSPIIGTSPWNLYQAVKSGYADTDLRCSFRYLDSLDAVPDGSIVLVVVKDAVLTDHCVAVLSHTNQTVTLADPMEGLVNVPRAQFAQQWRRCGIILQRPL